MRRCCLVAVALVALPLAAGTARADDLRRLAVIVGNDTGGA